MTNDLTETKRKFLDQKRRNQLFSTMENISVRAKLSPHPEKIDIQSWARIVYFSVKIRPTKKRADERILKLWSSAIRF